MTHGLTLADGLDVPDDLLAPLQAYVAGHATGEPAFFAEAFLPSAHVEGLRDGAFVSWDLETYRGLFHGRPADDEPDRRRVLDTVHAAEEVATATMTLHHGPDTFVDAFVLIRVEDRWWIANKVYQRR